ncbi:MAG: energy transducer TonB [Acidaminococcales bacterium]|jgi:protein TonB|nr:energy transducer TonB [Acidaminococcales bacterium]
MNGRKRHAAGFCGSLLAHLLLVALLAVLGVFTVAVPPSLTLEVSFAGSPGGGGGAAAALPRAAAVSAPPPAPDDIAEEKKPQRAPQETPPAPAARPPETSGGRAEGNDKDNAAGQGTGGIGSGDGKTQGKSRGGQGGGSGQGTQSALPRMIYYKEPNYPSSAIAAGAQGTVSIRLFVSARGAVENVSLEKSSGWREIDASVLTAAKQWRFSPAKDAVGKSMACYVDLPVNFRLRK